MQRDQGDSAPGLPEGGNQGALSEAASQNCHPDLLLRCAKSNSGRVPGVKEAHQSGGLQLPFYVVLRGWVS